MGLYFSDKQYLDKALQFADNPPESTHTFNEAILLCLSAAKPQKLDNLCAALQKKLPGLSADECFQLTRGQNVPGKVEFSDKVCDLIWQSAIQTLDMGLPLDKETEGLLYST